jgi:ApaG protein
MYSAKTNGIRINVEPTYLADESEPAKCRYFWAYSIDIGNERDSAVQLLSRHWVITDGNGRREKVDGAGLVGEQPIIEPGKKYTYTSGCPLPTPSGIMAGSYRMATSDGQIITVSIPAFSLDLPDQNRIVN